MPPKKKPHKKMVAKLRGDMLGGSGDDSDASDAEQVNGAFDVFADRGGDSASESGDDEVVATTGGGGSSDSDSGEDLISAAKAARADAVSLPPVSPQKKKAIRAAARAVGATVSAETDDEEADADAEYVANELPGAAALSERSLMASDSGRYFAQQICKTCGLEGHLKANCPDKHNKPCFLCGTRGHTVSDCPNQLCWHCGKPGHQSRSCSDRLKGKAGVAALQREKELKERSDAKKRSSGAGHKRFQDGNAEEAAAGAAEDEAALGGWACPLPVRGSGRDADPHFCFNCGKTEHRGDDCKEPGVDAVMGNGPPAGSRGGAGGNGCFVCGEVGHLARDCVKRSKRPPRHSAPAVMGRGGRGGK